MSEHMSERDGLAEDFRLLEASRADEAERNQDLEEENENLRREVSCLRGELKSILGEIATITGKHIKQHHDMTLVACALQQLAQWAGETDQGLDRLRGELAEARSVQNGIPVATRQPIRVTLRQYPFTSDNPEHGKEG